MSSVRCWVLSHPGPVLRFRGADESWRAMMNLLSCWYYRHVGTTLPALWGVKERLLGDIEEFLGEDTRRWYKEIRREPVKTLLTLLTDTHWHVRPSREIQDLLKTVLLVLACLGSRLDSTRRARHSAQEGLPFLRSSWIWQDVATGTARLCWRFLLVYVSQYIDVVSNYSKFGSKCLSCQAHTGNRWPFQAQPVPEPRDFSKVRETMLPHKNGWFHIHFHTKNGQFCASIDSPFLIPKSIARGHLHLTHPNLTDESLRAAVNQAPRHSSLEQRLLEYVNDLLYHAVSVSWFIDILRRYAVDTVCTICIGLLWKWAGWFSCGIYLLVN